MGGAKRDFERHQDQLARALAIGVEARVVVMCEFHEGVYLEGSEDITSAYKLGNHLYSHGQLDEIFDSRNQMTDLIKEAVEENSGGECYACSKLRNE